MRILMFSMDGIGHFNACVGLAKIFHKFGHEVHFGLPYSAKDYANEFDFLTIHVFEKIDDPEYDNLWVNWAKLEDGTFVFRLNPIDQIAGISVIAHRGFNKFNINHHECYGDLIKKIAPDLICIDSYNTVPAITTCGIPWILVYSANPLLAYQPFGAPAAGLGLGIGDDPAESEEYRKKRRELLKEERKDYVKWLASKGHIIDENTVVEFSPYLNVYSYPADMDYSEYGPVPEGWFRLDHMIRPVNDSPIGLDEQLLMQTQTKKIFFSLGSVGCGDISVFKKFISFMSNSKHSFIVSVGKSKGDLELPPNVFGGKFLNQLKILPHVDLVITHGGNNTFVETLYHGKPMIVLPLFADQRDNGRRVVDKKIGKCFKPYEVTEAEFLKAIDDILNDEEMRERVEKIGENIRKTQSHENLNKKIQDLCKAKQ
ncbi:uncharacterized protein LOC141856246 [Brevipalpus obovatus]|uniref:uncharacterized protein LOC141856246 n=1 Tax=Brevipalpus obovatus TaxID=246614 RepID=UPI003D9F8AFA